ncbi:MAG TPA: folate-binding protein [Devosia sp.]|nr:folate-binding protein [Devosia sp.]
MPTILRSSRALFRFSGPEAQKLLFDVVTGRVTEAPEPVWWALLSPQGKIQAEGLSGFRDGAFWLDVHVSVADEFFRRMRMYKLRANVTIEDLRATHVVGWSDSGDGDADPRGIGSRVIAEKGVGWIDDETTFVAARVAAGIAELGADFPPDAVFPHDIGMDLRDGIDFVKGCYVGQEVVSRMKHRGTARRRPVIVTGVPDGAAPGAPLMAGEREAGTLGMDVNGEAIAIVRLDRLADSGAATVGGIPVKLTIPAWGTYRFGESGTAE